MDYVIPTFISSQPGITLNRLEHDSGPASKFIPTIERELDAGRWDSIIVIADDDVIYPPSWLETYLTHYHSDPTLHGSALGMRGYCLPPANVWEWKTISKIARTGSNLTERTPADVLTANHGILFRPYYFKKLGPAITDEAPDSAHYMDDIWINGLLAVNGVKKFVIPAADDPVHRKVVQKATNTLENVPAGRAYHNNILLTYFEEHWDNCPLPEGVEVNSYYMKFTAPGKKHLNPPPEPESNDYYTPRPRSSSSSGSSSSTSRGGSQDDGAGRKGTAGAPSAGLLAALRKYSAEAAASTSAAAASKGAAAPTSTDSTSAGADHGAGATARDDESDPDAAFKQMLSRLAESAASGDGAGGKGVSGAATIDVRSVGSLFAERAKLRALQAKAASGSISSTDSSGRVSAASSSSSSSEEAESSARAGPYVFGSRESAETAKKSGRKGADHQAAAEAKVAAASSAAADRKATSKGAKSKDGKKNPAPGSGAGSGGKYTYYARRVTKPIDLSRLSAEFDGSTAAPTDAELAAKLKAAKEAEELEAQREKDAERARWASGKPLKIRSFNAAVNAAAADDDKPAVASAAAETGKTAASSAAAPRTAAAAAAAVAAESKLKLGDGSEVDLSDVLAALEQMREAK
jgi:hypothetical protein